MLTRKAKANQNQGWRGSAACSAENLRSREAGGPSRKTVLFFSFGRLDRKG
jgi:hypothetical protein